MSVGSVVGIDNILQIRRPIDKPVLDFCMQCKWKKRKAVMM